MCIWTGKGRGEQEEEKRRDAKSNKMILSGLFVCAGRKVECQCGSYFWHRQLSKVCRFCISSEQELSECLFFISETGEKGHGKGS